MWRLEVPDEELLGCFSIRKYCCLILGVSKLLASWATLKEEELSWATH